jgi:serine/threonine protein kinase
MDTTELTTIAKSIKAAKCPEDVFGMDSKVISATYRQLVLAIHPDHFQDDPKHLPIANEALNFLTSLRDAAERKLKAGTYGQKKVAAPPQTTPFSPIMVEAKGKKFLLTELLEEGDICDIYLCTVSNGSTDHKVVFKVARHGSDNDLVENESKILTELYPDTAKDEKFYRFLPKLSESFIMRSPGAQRKVNILPWLNEYRSLVEVLRVYPDGIDYRDMVWMFKRILHGVGFAHEHHIIHGALIPLHIMIHPVDHGAKIIDWSYAVKMLEPVSTKKDRNLYDYLNDDSFLTTQHIKAISVFYRDFYPQEILDKKIPTAATDIFMAAKCGVYLVSGDLKTNQMPDSVPKPVQAFFSACLLPEPTKRPQNAWDAHEELDAILLKVVGKRKYRPFPMPDARVR